jgi:hypothetical protein
MEARELLDDEVIVGREAYGGRSLVHHRLAQSSPELCAGEDDGRFAMLAQVFAERAKTLPMLFDPESPSIALRPSPAALKNCLAWLSGTQKVRSQEPATDAVFAAPDALGWAYQYWNTEEKDRVFETVRTKKGAKIEGPDIIPATQLYTEDYMVKFLVQNSLGATWMGMHPESKLSDRWEYYVRDADRAPATKKPLQQVTLLDPACGSGHFLIEAFDIFYSMYEEEGEITEPEQICKAILENNLFGIDIDARSIQIAEAALWMKAEERSMHFSGAKTNLVAATSSHLKGKSWDRYLAKLKNEPSTVRVLRRFAVEMEHIDELGSLARPAEALESIINEEHEIWEKQERERREADKSLFQEIRDDLLASQLPFQDISDKEFFERTMRHALFAIDGFTAEARESGEFNDQLMGIEAKTGFRLLDLLSRKYDVVVANPPYMGSKNMSPVLKKYVKDFYTSGKRDLYAAFMLRVVEFTVARGACGLLTQQYWLSNRYYRDLRAAEPEHGGILRDNFLQTMAHLGANAFSEITGEVVAVTMSVFRRAVVVVDERCTFLRVVEFGDPREKAKALLAACERHNENSYQIPQAKLLGVPDVPIIYWLSQDLFTLLSEGCQLTTVATLYEGCHPTDTQRFVRYFWETPNTLRWAWYSRGGEFCRWYGLKKSKIDYQNDFARHRATGKAIIPSRHKYFQGGVTYTDFASGNMAARVLDCDEIFSDAAPAVIGEDGQRKPILALLNSRVVTAFMRVLSPSPLHFRTGYLAKVPVPRELPDDLQKVEDACVTIKKAIVSHDITERTFSPNTLNCNPTESATRLFALQAALHELEAWGEALVFDAYQIRSHGRRVIEKMTGEPSGNFPIVPYRSEFIDISTTVENWGDLMPRLQSRVTAVDLSDEQDSRLIEKLKSLFCSDLNSEYINQIETFDDDSDEGEESSASQTPIPSQSPIDDLSRQLAIHPRTICTIVNAGMLNGGWIFRPQQLQHWSDRVSMMLLQLLGHTWPAAEHIRETVAKHVDDDGIIPVVIVEKEPTLQDLVIQLLHQSKVDSPHFAEIAGKPIDDWITVDFFKHHINQFRKRPIAWQIQSSGFTNRMTPAFACFAYYQRVDLDTIPKIRSQYTRPLNLRFETEMRGISATPVANRTDGQAKRTFELEEAIRELQAFDENLASVARSGFGPARLLPTLRQYAFDDAMLSMKAFWLQRLSELLSQSAGDQAGNGVRNLSPLDDWKDQAIRTELHQDLAEWIGEALSHLNYFCSQVGPNAPDAKQTPEDPTAGDFGSLIQAEITTMQTDSMRLACGVWWGKFDAAVLAPIRERLKILKAEQKELNAAIKEDRQPVLVAEKVPEESAEDGDSDAACVADDMPLFGNDQAFEQTTELTKAAMTARLKEVKAKIKKFTEEMDAKAGKAQAIRDSIQAWRLPDPIPDSLDFRPSSPTLPPLFDQVSSLDERRAPPKTIAEFIAQESLYAPDINDGVRVNIAPLQKAGILAADVLAAKDVDKAIADRAEWRADERRWVREGKLPQPGWWKVGMNEGGGMKAEETDGSSAPTDGVAGKQFVSDGKDDQ